MNIIQEFLKDDFGSPDLFVEPNGQLGCLGEDYCSTFYPKSASSEPLVLSACLSKRISADFFQHRVVEPTGIIADGNGDNNINVLDLNGFSQLFLNPNVKLRTLSSGVSRAGFRVSRNAKFSMHCMNNAGLNRAGLSSWLQSRSWRSLFELAISSSKPLPGPVPQWRS